MLADAPPFVLAAMCVDGVGWLATDSAVHEPRKCVPPSCMIRRVPPPCEELAVLPFALMVGGCLLLLQGGAIYADKCTMTIISTLFQSNTTVRVCSGSRSSSITE